MPFLFLICFYLFKPMIINLLVSWINDTEKKPRIQKQSLQYRI